MPVSDTIPRDETLLSDEERARIYAEELVRHRAREEAKRLYPPRKSAWQALRDGVNSAFGLWLLSTVVIGYGSYEYKSRQERSARHKEADRLEIELKHRLSHLRKVVATLSREAKEAEDAGNDPWGLKFAARLRAGYRYVQTGESAFFSNHANDNLQALFTALQDKLRGLDEKKAVVIDDCLGELKHLRKRCEDDYQAVPRPDSTKTHDAYFRHVRWMIDDTLRRLEGPPLSLWSTADAAADARADSPG